MKDGVEKPLFDYERKIFEALQSHKHVWIKKATGLGITEYFLRYIAWLCLRNEFADLYCYRFHLSPRMKFFYLQKIFGQFEMQLWYCNLDALEA